MHSGVFLSLAVSSILFDSVVLFVHFACFRLSVRTISVLLIIAALLNGFDSPSLAENARPSFERHIDFPTIEN